jgi:DNA polymerase-3 subunit delta
MQVTLTGDNAFALRQELRRLTDAFVAEHGDLALERVDASEADPARVREALTGLPFLAARKLVVLRGLGTNKQLQENIEQLLHDLPETTDVIFVEPKPDKRLSYYKLLKKATDLREFPEPDAGGLARWLADTARDCGGSLGPGDARYLVERVGPNQQLLSGELEKLLLHNPKISRADIENLTEAAPQSTIFQLLEAAFAGDRRRTLGLYAEQRAQSVEPIQIIAMLAWQLHVLAVIKTAGDRGADAIAREARLNPFVVRKSQGIARRLSLPQLKKLVEDLLKIDVQSKRTNLDPDEALQHYLLSLAA